MLFPPPSPRQAPPVWTRRATTSSSTVLRNQNLSYNNSVAPDIRRHSSQHLRSPATFPQQIPQDPRVASVIAQAQGYRPSSLRFSLPGLSQHQRIYAASDPSNSPRSTRPPVPLFSDTERTAFNNTQAQQEYPRIMATSTIPQGSFASAT